VPHRKAHKGSFQEDWDDLLVRFAHKGTPAALEDQILEARPKIEKSRECRSFMLNQALFEASWKLSGRSRESA